LGWEVTSKLHTSSLGAWRVSIRLVSERASTSSPLRVSRGTIVWR
jgi:hypothetical protein